MFMNEYFWNDYIIGEQVYIILTILLVPYLIFLFRKYFRDRSALQERFEDVKDLVRGSVFVPVKDIWDAYQHFKSLDGIRVVKVKSLEKMEFI